MATLQYVKGDVTKPQRNEDEDWITIPHIVNDIGAFGAGVSGALARAFPEVKTNYRQRGFYTLGDVDFIYIKEDKITVANMIGQHGISSHPKVIQQDEHLVVRQPIRYAALAHAMEEVRRFCRADNEPWCEIHAPRFGSALAGGNWATIESLIYELWVDWDISVTIYDYEG